MLVLQKIMRVFGLRRILTGFWDLTTWKRSQRERGVGTPCRMGKRRLGDDVSGGDGDEEVGTCRSEGGLEGHDGGGLLVDFGENVTNEANLCENASTSEHHEVFGLWRILTGFWDLTTWKRSQRGLGWGGCAG